MIMSRYSQMMEEFSHISQATEYSLETLLIMDIHRTGLKLIGNNTCRGSVIIRIGERFFVTYIANSAGLKTNYEIRRINDNWKLFYESK